MKELLEMEVGYIEQSVRFNKYSSKTRIPILKSLIFFYVLT